MNKCCGRLLLLFMICIVLCVVSCAKVPIKRFYLVNYEPDILSKRLSIKPYPVTLRIKEFDIEEAYAKSQIAYRTNPYELQYYYFRQWAVKPSRMMTDLLQKHIVSVGLVNTVVRRYDESIGRPDFELGGTIEAIEEYDSDRIRFAHLALRIKLTRLHDNKTLYIRHFNQRKQVYQMDPSYIVRVLSQISDILMTQIVYDLDSVFAKTLNITMVADTLSTHRLLDVLDSGAVNDTSKHW